MLNSIFSQTAPAGVTMAQFLACTMASLIMGILLAAIHEIQSQSSGNFIVTLAVLPAVVQAVIMLVNGNLGTGVAVMGAFGLVRFRSVPGNAREIGSIFLAMAIGLACGMGCLGIAGMLLVLVGAAMTGLSFLPVVRGKAGQRALKVTIPENLDYRGIFDDIFEKYTGKASLLKVKTVNMGSLYELQYMIRLKSESDEKAMIDEIRCRNGNLGIVCAFVADSGETL